MPPPHPLTTARRASSSIHRQKGLLAGTSANTGVVQAGGTYPAPSFATSTNTAICSRVVELAGQYWVALQPPVTPWCSSVSMKR